MMSKANRLKKEKINNSIDISQRESNCKNVVAFSFHHVTTNKRHNFEQLEDEAILSLFSKFKLMTDMGWLALGSSGKSQGFELIPLSSVKITPKGLGLVKDSKFHSIRFNHQKYQLIGYRPNGCDILHIIGIDYDYSAYNHG
ncbi:MAG: hypothetical protein LBN34_06255 [Clostridiales Family XIII bacterium]|jgi:hypothetical protein|nr:hypothetical protein [Clostridiales Family XIII bacterium]